MDKLEQLKSIIAEQLDLDPAEIKLESNLIADLKADSLDMLDLVMTFEETFDTTLPDDELEKIKTVGDIWELIQNL